MLKATRVITLRVFNSAVNNASLALCSFFNKLRQTKYTNSKQGLAGVSFMWPISARGSTYQIVQHQHIFAEHAAPFLCLMYPVV